MSNTPTKPAANFRLLRVGEKIRKGTLVFLGEWREMTFWFGRKINPVDAGAGMPVGWYARKITARKTAATKKKRRASK